MGAVTVLNFLLILAFACSGTSILGAVNYPCFPHSQVQIRASRQVLFFGLIVTFILFMIKKLAKRIKLYKDIDNVWLPIFSGVMITVPAFALALKQRYQTLPHFINASVPAAGPAKQPGPIALPPPAATDRVWNLLVRAPWDRLWELLVRAL